MRNWFMNLCSNSQVQGSDRLWLESGIAGWVSFSFLSLVFKIIIWKLYVCTLWILDISTSITLSYLLATVLLPDFMSCACMCACVHACMRACVSMCACMCVHVHVCVCVTLWASLGLPWGAIYWSIGSKHISGYTSEWSDSPFSSHLSSPVQEAVMYRRCSHILWFFPSFILIHDVFRVMEGMTQLFYLELRTYSLLPGQLLVPTLRRPE